MRRARRIALGTWLALACAAAPAAASGAPDPVAYPAPEVRAWQTGLLRADRISHASLAFTVGLSTGVATRSTGAAVGTGLALGLAKEAWDMRRDAFDWLDIAADLAGAVLGGALTHAIER